MSQPLAPRGEGGESEALSDPAAATAAITAALASLSPALELLERFHHRNRNQHRTSRWWAPADMLRRHMRKMLGELEAALGEAERRERKRARTAAGVTMKKGKEKDEHMGGRRKESGGLGEELMEVVVKRATYLRGQLGPGAYLAFTQLAADRQFAHLGLMLLGVLAQVDQAVAPFAPTAREAPGTPKQMEMDASLSRRDRDGPVDVSQDQGSDTAMDIDVGVAVSREEVMASIERDQSPKISASTPVPRLPSSSGPTGSAGQAYTRSISLPINPPTHQNSLASQGLATRTEPASKRSSVNPVPETKPKKKKTRKGDEFDDIFGELDGKSKKPKKKKRKKGDEFDDIFGGL
ncbi:hypothetical protein VTI28DRAFT_2751 [Corynascus sepedonium]